MQKELGSGYLAAANSREGQYELFLMEIETDSSHLYFTNANEVSITALNSYITDGSNAYVTWLRLPFTVSDYELNSAFELPKITVKTAILPGTILSLIRGNNGIRGKTVYLTRTYRHLIGTDTSSALERLNRSQLDLTVDSTKITHGQVEIVLTTKLEAANITVPKRRFYKDFCSRTYLNFDPTAADASNHYADGYCSFAGQTVDSTTCYRYFDTCLNLPYFSGCPGIPTDRVIVR